MKIVRLFIAFLLLSSFAYGQSSPPERRDYKLMIAQENTPSDPLPFIVVTRTGTGLNGFSTGVTFDQTVMATYVITIATAATPDTFNWTKTGGSGNESANGVAITGALQTLGNDAFQVKWTATTGHTAANTWTIKVFPENKMFWDGITGTFKARWSNATTTNIGGTPFDPASPGNIGTGTPGSAVFGTAANQYGKLGSANSAFEISNLANWGSANDYQLRMYSTGEVIINTTTGGYIRLNRNGIGQLIVDGNGVTIATQLNQSFTTRTLGAGSVALSVSNFNIIGLTGNVATSTISSFTNGVAGQEVTCIFLDGLVTISSSVGKTVGGVPIVGTTDDSVTFTFDGTTWRQKGGVAVNQ